MGASQSLSATTMKDASMAFDPFDDDVLAQQQQQQQQQNHSLLPSSSSTLHNNTTNTAAANILNNNTNWLQQYQVHREKAFCSCSGRMMRTYRLQHKRHHGWAVCKAMWVSQQDLAVLQQQLAEIQRIQSALLLPPQSPTTTTTLSSTTTTTTTTSKQPTPSSHVMPFMAWSMGSFRSIGPQQQVAPVYLLRPYFYTTVSDRMASRPFLTHVEKVWITFQLLQALQDLHEQTPTPVVHGFITTENMALTSWNWLVLVDVASYKAHVTLPDDDPSDYLYYFQEHVSSNSSHYNNNTASAATSNTNPSSAALPREKRCYLAPERFVSRQQQQQQQSSSSSTSTSSSEPSPQLPPPHQLTPAMDIFSAGCCILELFLNGERAMDLGDLMEYRRQQGSNNSTSKNSNNNKTINTSNSNNNNKTGSTSSTSNSTLLQQRLQKVESSAIRAACRHMLHVNPQQRLSAREYLERLQQTTSTSSTPKSANASSKSTVPSQQQQQQQQQPVIPPCFTFLSQLVGQCTTQAITPDERLALLAANYGTVLWETLGIQDGEGANYFGRILGTSTITSNTKDSVDGKDQQQQEHEDHVTAAFKEENGLTKTGGMEQDSLLDETEALLKKLEALELWDDVSVGPEGTTASTATSVSSTSTTTNTTNNNNSVPAIASTTTTAPRSDVSKDSIIIYLQVILANIRHVQRPMSKLVGLQLLQRLAKYSSDEARLQRIVPTTVSLLQDQDPLVRAFCLQVMTSTLAMIQTFPPSDSKIFPQYIFKRVAPLINDSALVVRVAFARSVATLAETALSFLDVSHAVRLYEAVGGGVAAASKAVVVASGELKGEIFTDDLTKLLDNSSTSSSSEATKKTSNNSSSNKLSKLPSSPPTEPSAHSSAAGKVLISTTYNAELAGLQETISRWVSQLTVDPSEHSSAPKRAVLRDLARLCTFFGRDGVLSFILPQVLAFLNDRKDWELRSALLEALPLACHMIGRASTQHFVLPCMETALGDAEERVMSSALVCLAELLDLGLIARSTLIGTLPGPESSERNDGHSNSTRNGHHHQSGLFVKCCPFLLYPSSSIRHRAIAVVNKSCKAVGFPDAMVYFVPLLKSYLRFSPSTERLTTSEGLEKCLFPPWSREELHEEMVRMGIQQPVHSPTSGQWTSVGISIRESEGKPSANPESTLAKSNTQDGAESHNTRLVEYVHALSQIRRHSVQQSMIKSRPNQLLKGGLEGSIKLSQNVLIPRQAPLAGNPATLPAWYSVLRDISELESSVSESHAIRSVSELSAVYGLSIMNAAVNQATGQEKDSMSEDEARRALNSTQSKIMESASVGEWGAEARVDPGAVDTSLLVSKLKGLAVPPLSPKLGVVGDQDSMGYLHVEHHLPRDTREAANWKPKVDALLATSSPAAGHSAPVVRLAVSRDQRFFASASHDGSCRIWELQQIEDSTGILDSSVVYTGHATDSSFTCPRVNDVAMIEGSHSVVSGASDGSVHVWRVDMVSKSKQSVSSESGGSTFSNPLPYERSKVSGTSVVRQLDPAEGEVLAVSHFNTPAASIVTFCSKGSIHTWDLRSATEPFVLAHSPDIGYLTTMALGSDRNWIVSGTSRGVISLWDLRFQKTVKVWQHSRQRPINRLATSFVLPIQAWTGRGYPNAEARPFIFAASGPNECAMFDATNGSCQACFRSIVTGVGNLDQNRPNSLPSLQELPTSTKKRLLLWSRNGLRQNAGHGSPTPEPSINAMVGSIGTGDNSYLITGGDDCQIRCWDFAVPSRCYTISGRLLARPSVERLDFGSTRLMQSRHDPHSAAAGGADRFQRRLFHGMARAENRHFDSVQDLKIVESPIKSLLSCSRDGTIKVWR